MNELLSPKNDVVFQKLFGDPKNKHILISFLNSIIIKSGNDEIKDVKVEEKKLDVSLLLDEKISILDIYVTTNKNTHINVEMQIINQYNMTKRTLFYWSKMFLKQLKKGEEYDKLNKTITINLVDFNFLDCDKFHSYYHLYEDELKVQLTDIMEIHFVELKKFEKIDKRINDKLHNWISFINNPNGEGVESMAIADNDIKSARDILTIISGDKEVKELAELREKSLKDEISRISGAREEGIKEGIEKEKISNAKNLLKLGVDVEIVAKGTSLSIEEVIALKNEIVK